MKQILCAGVLTAALLSPPAWAGTVNDSTEMLTAGALSAVAAPVLLVAGVAVGAGGIIKLVGKTGGEISELTGDVLQDLDRDSTYTAIGCDTPCNINVTIQGEKKEIPLVVRKQYVQMNMRVAD